MTEKTDNTETADKTLDALAAQLEIEGIVSGYEDPLFPLLMEERNLDPFLVRMMKAKTSGED